MAEMEIFFIYQIKFQLFEIFLEKIDIKKS